MDYDAIKRELIVSLFKLDAIKFGNFVLKSKTTSPIYVDFRGIISSPDLLVLITAIHVCTSFPRGSSIDGINCHKRMLTLNSTQQRTTDAGV